MAKGILYVETRPVRGQEAVYNAWYDGTHVKEIVESKGFLSARRFAPVDDDGPYVAVYEIESDDLVKARDEMMARLRSGATSKPQGVDQNSPPKIRLLREISSYVP
jgi:hypothetical protein